MTVGIITNTSKEAALTYSHQITAFLQARGIQTELGPAPGANFWVVLGGDGTMLRASRHAAVHGIPMLGINFGNLGYLTDVESHEGITALEKVLALDYKQEKRIMLETGPNQLALNDMYLTRSGFGKMLELDLFINGGHIDTIRADGIIVSTPTGSTAYNLSAGGPILMPDGEMLAITAICPHSMHTRPWVVSAHDEITVKTHHDVTVTLDGDVRSDMAAGETITVRRAKYDTLILKTSDLHFSEILRRKMYP
jgi:NAD+ kinase